MPYVFPAKLVTLNLANLADLTDPTFLSQRFGEGADAIVELLEQPNSFSALHRGYTDGDIAYRTKFEVTTVRKALYKLRHFNLVEARPQTRDDGGTTYFWHLKVDQLSNYLTSLSRTKIEQLRSQLAFERSHIFLVCERDTTRVTYEEAMEGQMVCPKCHGPLQSLDNSKVIANLESEIHSLEPPSAPLELQTTPAKAVHGRREQTVLSEGYSHRWILKLEPAPKEPLEIVMNRADHSGRKSPPVVDAKSPE